MHNTIAASTHRIATPHGTLHAQCWQPATAKLPFSAMPILLLHDSLGCVALWRDFPALLAEQTGHPVIAYDRLGFGQSDARDDRLELDFIATEAVEYFPLLQAHFGFARCIVMGHSVGGGMAVYCAAMHPDSCAALITESAQAFVEDRTRSGIALARTQFRQPDAMQRLARYHGDKAKWVVDAWTETWLAPDFADWSLAAVLPQVRCPTLVIHGTEDEYGTKRHPQQIAAGVQARAELHLMPGIRHVPHREQDVTVARMIRHFLRHPSPGNPPPPDIFRYP
ncbi:alpha/beta fold hydrolase [Aquitalea denitrificans]|uniref:alpha/beta fold hydrolase n=1 Tax=Aquitalea denitrificans TaxID=519081 RepID=UPI00135B83EA|nr:alpha/beta hydrolase [Aquitalea denitrificans]